MYCIEDNTVSHTLSVVIPGVMQKLCHTTESLTAHTNCTGFVNLHVNFAVYIVQHNSLL